MRGFRIFLVALAACAVVGTAAVMLLWQRFAPVAEEFFASVEADAASFADGRDQSACVPEALARLTRCEGLACQVKTPAFTRICLTRAAPNPAICNDVPDSLLDSILWPQTACVEIDAEPRVCERILREQVRACQGRSAGASGG